MEAQQTAGSLVSERVPADLTALSSLATRVLKAHTDAAGLCTVCRSAWPCELVILADHNLAAL